MMKKSIDPRGETANEDAVFLFQQIVKNMSGFIGKIAEDVQGGVHYFNELPYFVSIHSRDCIVLSVNSVYREHLGEREGQDSWCVYLDSFATAEDNPIKKTVDKTRAI